MSGHSLFRQLVRRVSRRPAKKTPPRSIQIRLDSLEDRLAPAGGTVRFEVASSSAAEGGTPTVEVRLQTTNNQDLNGIVVVNVADAGGGTALGGGTDYTLTSGGTVTFDNSTPFTMLGTDRVYRLNIALDNTTPTQSKILTIADDRRVEAPETANFQITSVTAVDDSISLSGSTLTHQLSITDNDSAKITYSGTADTSESGTTGTGSATLSLVTTGSGTEGLDTAVSATITSATSDFTANSVTWNAGDSPSTKDITVTATNDRLVEASPENLTGTPSVTTLANFTTEGTAAVNVTDNDSATVSIVGATSTLTEGGGSQNVQATLTLTTDGSGPAELAVPISANLPGNADYTSVGVTFGVGAVSGATDNIVISAVDDQRVEATTETFNGEALAITSSGGAIASATGAQNIVVNDNDSATVSIPGGTTILTEGGSSQDVPVTLTLITLGSGTQVLDVAVSANLPGNGDYTATAATFAAGSLDGNTANVVVAAVDDRNVEAATESFANQALAVTSNGGASVTVSGSQTIVVNENDSASVAITTPGTTTLTEGGSSANVGVTLTLNTTGTTGTAQLDVPVTANLPGNADYSTTAATFDVGSISGATANVVVAAVDDQFVEGQETFSNEALGVSSTAIVSATTSETIVVNDNDTATISITSPGTSTVTEGGPSANVGVTLTLATSGTTGTPALAVDVSVNLPGNADYSSAAATFLAGSVSGATANVVVSGVDDRRVEPQETFPGQALAVTSSGGAAVTASGSENIIVNDNDSATISVASATTTLTEGGAAQNVVATLTLNTPGSGDPQVLDVDISANLPTTNPDYTSAGVTFVAGSTDGNTQNIVVDDIDDQLVEGTETFTNQALAITSNGGAAATASGAQTIVVNDNDSATISIPTATTTLTEGGGSQNIVATLNLSTSGTGTAGLANDVSVNLPGNADYSGTAATFLAGATSGATANVVVTAVDDLLVEGQETFLNQALAITSGGGGVTASGSQDIVVNDNDTATISITTPGTSTVTEGGLSANVGVTLTLATSGTTGTPALAVDVSVNLPGNADYSSAAATFLAGSPSGATANVVVSGVDDRRVEPQETFPGQALAVTSSGGAAVTASGSENIVVNDNDSATISITTGNTSLTEGGTSQNLTATLTLNTPGSGDPQVLDVDISANLPTTNLDYTSVGVTFLAGALSGDTQTIVLDAVNDRLVEASTETFVGQALAITSNGGATATASGSRDIAVIDNESATISITPATTLVTEGGSTQNILATLAISSDGTGSEELAVSISANLPTTNADYTPIGVTFTSGATTGASADIVVAAVNDRLVEAITESFTAQALSITSSGGANVTASGDQDIVVTDNDSATVAVAPGTTTAAEGGPGQNVVATLTLNTTGTGPEQLAVPVTVNLPGNADYNASAATFASGSATGATANVVVTAVDDKAVEPFTEIFAGQSLTAPPSNTANVTATGSRTIAITENDSARVTYSGTANLTEGTAGFGLVQATLSLITSGSGTDQLDTPVSATITSSTNDFAAATVTWAAGEAPGGKDIPVTVINDRIVEQTIETNTANLVPSSAAIVESTGSATVVVTDNDSASVAITSPGTTNISEGGASANVGVTLTLNTSGDGSIQLGVPVAATLPGNADYSAVAATFAAGSANGATANVAVSATDDAIVEAQETFTGQALSATSTATVAASGSQSIQVTDNDTAIFTISDVTVNEDAGTATFTVSLDKMIDTDVTIDVSYGGGTATGGGVDYDSTTDSVTFTAGSTTSQSVTVAITNDNFHEPTESFVASLAATSALGGRSVNTSDTATATIVDNDNGQPTVQDRSLSLAEDTSISATLTGSDPENDPLTFSIVSGPTHGTINLDPQTGSFTYAPAANYNGSDSFTYKANDGNQDSNTATVSLTITAVNDAPVANSGSATTDEDAAVSGTVTATDVDGNTLTFSVVAGPTHGTLTSFNTSTGEFTYSPSGNYNGSDSFTFKANDGTVDSNIATLAITINPVNDAPVAIDASYSTNEDTTLTGAVTASDVDGNTLTYSVYAGANHGTVTVSSNGTFVYTPNANYNGLDSFTFKANDGTVDSNIGSVLVTVNAVNDAPVANNGSGVTDEDTALSGTVTASDVDNVTLTFSVVAGPTHGTLSSFNGSTGEFTYTPAANYNGSDSFTFKANDGSLDSNVATFSITVNAVNDAPVANSASASTNEDTTLIGAVSATDADGNALTYSLVNAPTNGTVTVSSNGTFVYTPAANFNGSDSFTFKANDGTVDSNVATISITVNAVNDAPVANNGTLTTDEDTSANGTVTASDVDSPTLTFSVISGPAHGTLSTFNATSGAFTYTPAANYNGPDSFTFVANDGTVDSNVATFSITVNAVNDAPVANSASFSTNEDTTLTGAVSATDVDNAVLTYSLVSGATHGAVTVSSNGTFVYVPNANYNGPDSFTFKANDGSLDSNVATISITVNSVNDAPVANSGSLTTNEDTAGSGTLTASDVDTGAILTFTIVSGPTHGTLTAFDGSTGTFTYTPAGNYNGPDSFTFTANDGTVDSNTATISFTVNAVNDAPVAANGSGTTNEDTVLIGSLSATDVDNAVLTYSLVSGPAASAGTVTVNGNGTFVYTPAANFNGTASFSFKANDGSLDSNTATVTLTINAVNDAPVANSGSASTNEDVAVNGNVVAADVDAGAVLTYSVVAGPSHGTLTSFNPATGAFTYTPAGNYNGSDSFTFKANDGTVDSNTATISLNIAPVNDNPTANNDGFVVAEDSGVSTLTVLTNDSSAPDTGETLTITATGAASHGTVAIGPGGTSVLYTPAPNYNGPDSFTYTISDGNGGTATATVNVTVSGSNDLPTAVNDSASLIEDAGAQAINVLANDSSAPDTGETLTIISVTQGLHGTVTIVPGNLSLTYTPNADFAGSDTFLYTISDGNGGTATAAVVVDVANDAADRLEVITTPGVTTFTEVTSGSAIPVVVDAGIRVGSALEGIIKQATVKIAAGYVSGKDKLQFTNTTKIKGTFNATTATLTLTGQASPAEYQAALRSVKFVNASPMPVDGLRTVTFKVQDAAGVGTEAAKIVRVVGVNTKPTLTSTTTALNYRRGAAAVAVAPTLTIKDVDNTRLQSARVAIGGAFAANLDKLTWVNKTGITASFNAATGILTLTGNATLATYQALLRSVKFSTTTAAPAGARTISITVNDGLLDSDTINRTVNVT